MGDKEITKNLVYLTKNLTDLQDVLIHLVQEEIISTNEKDEIMQSGNTPMVSNDKLLAIIQKKDWLRVRDPFLEILRRTNNEHCADEIGGKESQATNNEITKNLVYLADHLTNLHGVLNHLQQGGTISRDERVEIESEKTSSKRNDKLLSLIQKKDWPRKRDRFLEILRQTNNEHCSDEIEGKQGQSTANIQTESQNVSKKSTITTIKKSEIQKYENIHKWWPEEKQLIPCLHKRNHGNKLLVEELHERIQKDKNRMVVLCESPDAAKLTGMGGVGKTLTAKWYAHHYKEEYAHILWIDCGEDSLKKSFQKLARDLRVKDRNELTDVEDFARKTFLVLSEFKCLWIFDNAESYQGEDGIFKVLPKGQENFFCLITSRSREWGVKNAVPTSDLQLEIFSDEESLAFFKENLNEEINRNEHQLKELCRLMGNFPLALQLAANALNRREIDLQTYLDKTRVEDLAEIVEAKFDDYEKTINKNIKISLDLILKKKGNGKLAFDILMVFGYIRPDNVQSKLFVRIFKSKVEDVKEAVDILEKYSLVSITGKRMEFPYDDGILNKMLGRDKVEVEMDVLSIHRLLQQVIRFNGKTKEKEIVRKILGCEGFIDYKLLPFTKYADKDLKKEFPKVKAQLLDQQQLRKLKRENRFDECVQLAQFIHQELQKPATKLNYAICLHLNGQVEGCLKTAEELLAEFNWTVEDDQLSRILEQMLVHLKRINLRVDIKINYYLMDSDIENNEKLREVLMGDLLLFSYLRLGKFDEAIAIGKRTTSQERILARFIDQGIMTKTTKLNYAICLQKNGQWQEAVKTLNELQGHEMKDEIEYGGWDVEMGLLKLDVEVSRELVGGHLLLAHCTMNNKQKIQAMLDNRKHFKIIPSNENLDILIRLVHSHLIHYNYSLYCMGSFESFFGLKLAVKTKIIELNNCSLSLDSFDKLSPEVLTLRGVSFFRDGQELEKVNVNNFLDFSHLKRLTLLCDKKKKNVRCDFSGDVSIDILRLHNVEVLNWSSCNWNVKKLYLWNIPFVEKTHIQVQQMTIKESPLDVSCLQPTIQNIILSQMEVFVNGEVGFPNLKHLKLMRMSNVGCLTVYQSAPLTHINLKQIKEVDVDLLPRTLSHLHITKSGNLRIVGGVRELDTLRLKDFSFFELEECLSHFHIQNRLIHYKYVIGAKYFVEMMKKQIQTIAVGWIKWGKEEFKDYSSQLDREAEFYLLEGGRGRGMEREEFFELLKADFPL